MAFTIDAKTKKAAIVIGLAVAAYLVYRYYKNKKSGTSTSLGTNLNSVPSELIGGSAGPESGLNYYAGDTTVNVTEDITQSATSTVSPKSTATNISGSKPKSPVTKKPLKLLPPGTRKPGGGVSGTPIRVPSKTGGSTIIRPPVIKPGG